MSFREVKRRAVALLKEGRFEHEQAGVANGKNLLATGEVTAAEVEDFLSRCRGDQYESSPHHYDLATLVHVFKPVKAGQQWYVKFHFVEDEDIGFVMFMSVHRSSRGRRR